MDTDEQRLSTCCAPRPPSPRRGRGGASMTLFEEVRNVERLVATSRMRSFPFHFWCRQVIESGRPSPELLAAAERSKKIWDEYSEEAGGRLR
jgi:hypothetical protein